MKYPSINDALERAEIRAQELPHIIQVKESDWDTVVLANEVKRLKREVERLTVKKIPPPTTPITPWPKSPKDWLYSQCEVCGMHFNGPMGYVCPRSDCPTAVTCGGTIKDKFID